MVRPVLGALAEAALSRPRATLGGAVGLLVVFGIIASGAPQRLGVAGPESTGSESERAESELTNALGREPEPGMQIVTRGRVPVSSRVYEVALDALTSQAEADSEVAAVRRGPVSADKSSTVLDVYFRSDDPGAQQRAVEHLRDELDPGILTALVGGEDTVLLDARLGLGEELAGLELLALPLTVLVLVLAAGLRRAAAPVLAAAIAILGSIALMRLAAGLVDLSALGAVVAAAVGLTLGIELPLSLIAGLRDRDAGMEPSAITEAVLTGPRGGAVAGTSVAAAAAALALLAIPEPAATSAAVGGAVAALLAGIAALAVTPSVLALTPPEPVQPPDPADAQSRPGIPIRLSGWIGGRLPAALVATLVVVVGLVAAASPLRDGETIALGATGLPADAEARRADARITTDLGRPAATRLTAALPGPFDRRQVEELRRELIRTNGVGSAARPQRPSAELTAIGVGLEARRGSLVARDAVREVRAVTDPGGAEITGVDAAALDADERLFERLPVAAAIAALAVAILLFAFVRTPFLALGLGLSALLPAAAAVGLLTLVFDDGLLTGPLDYEPQGAPHLDVVLAVVAGVGAVSAGRSALYAITLAGDRQATDPSGAPLRAASLMLPSAGAATLIAAAAAGVLVGSDLVPAKEVGAGLAAGLVLDLVGLRLLATPALGRLLQRTRS
jgi:trehalose monomycolate/heme transporter